MKDGETEAQRRNRICPESHSLPRPRHPYFLILAECSGLCPLEIEASEIWCPPSGPHRPPSVPYDARAPHPPPSLYLHQAPGFPTPFLYDLTSVSTVAMTVAFLLSIHIQTQIKLSPPSPRTPGVALGTQHTVSQAPIEVIHMYQLLQSSFPHYDPT